MPLDAPACLTRRGTRRWPCADHVPSLLLQATPVWWSAPTWSPASPRCPSLPPRSRSPPRVGGRLQQRRHWQWGATVHGTGSCRACLLTTDMGLSSSVAACAVLCKQFATSSLPAFSLQLAAAKLLAAKRDAGVCMVYRDSQAWLSAGCCCAAGVDKIYGRGELNDYEQEGLKSMMPELIASIEKGIKFAKEN
jgi:hypothetical protein